MLCGGEIERGIERALLEAGAIETHPAGVVEDQRRARERECAAQQVESRAADQWRIRGPADLQASAELRIEPAPLHQDFPRRVHGDIESDHQRLGRRRLGMLAASPHVEHGHIGRQ